MSVQKLPMLLPLRETIPRISATATHDADAGREPVLHRQPDHLAEVAHRRLAAVELPVGVRQERRGGVERDVPGRGFEALGVQARPVPQRSGVRRMRYSSSQPASEKMIRLFAYCFQSCSRSGSARKTREEQALGSGEERRQEHALAACRRAPCSCPASSASAVRMTTNSTIVSQPRNVIVSGLESATGADQSFSPRISA